MLRVGYAYINASHTLSYITESCFMKCLSCLMTTVTRQNQHLCVQRRLKLFGIEYFTYLQTKFVKGLCTFCSEGRCWKCSADLPISHSQLFCKICHALQSPNKNVNLFNILQVDESYEVNVPAITSNYRKLQNLLHPDRYANKSEKEKSNSEDYSSLLNKAYSTLTDPLKRAVYMLELRDVFIREDSIQSPEFLMEIMEKNEELAESKDANSVKKIDRENKLILKILSREVAEAFKAGDLFKAKDAIVKMKYYTSFSEKIKELKMRIGIVED